MSAEIQLNDPQTLYRRWEDSQWNPFAIDLDADREQWAAMERADRDLLHWVLSSLMVAEERITTKFSGLVGAHGTEEEATFLSTQQVDEARHMQFYARFQDEVIASPATVAAHVERARREVSPAFERIFDGALVEAHERLVAEPGSRGAKVRFITLYHLILEGTLGLTTFRFATGHLEREGCCRASSTATRGSTTTRRATSATASGSCARRCASTPSAADDVRATLRELLPSVAEALSPSSDGDGPDLGRLGVEPDEIRGFALDGLTRRLDIIGVPLSSIAG